MSTPFPPSASDRAVIERTLAMLGDVEPRAAGPEPATVDLPDLVKRIDAAGEPDQVPIRTIHHLSCTGGTIITKCIAAMPNVLVLNEIDPLSTIYRNETPFFRPTDLVGLLHHGDPRTDPELVERLFVAEMGFLLNEQARIGRSLLLRDHSHSHFLIGPTVPERRTLRDILAPYYRVLSIVTVRDPVDSYLSLKEHGWHVQFSPATFDEYCRRYLLFLERHRGVPTLSYEAFTQAPAAVMARVCEILALDYSAGFLDRFAAIALGGDSGRSGSRIEPRPPRRRPAEMLAEIETSPSYKALTQFMSAIPEHFQ